MSVCLYVLCGGHSEDTIVTINLKFGMWTQNVNISSRFSDILFILIIKGSALNAHSFNIETQQNRIVLFLDLL